MQPLPGVDVGATVGVAVGAVVGVAVGAVVGVAVGALLGVAVGCGVAVGAVVGVAVGAGDGVGVLVPPLSVSATESMKKSVARLPVWFDVQSTAALVPANEERLTVSVT